MKKAKVEKKPVGIVSGNQLLPESELIKYSGGYAVEHKPSGIANLVEPPAVPSSDLFKGLNEAQWAAVGYGERPPAFYSGDNPPRSKLDVENWLRCMREQGERKGENDEPVDGLVWGQL